MPNNYNTNKHGPDIQTCTSHDHDSSRMYFEENIEILQHNSYSKSCIAFYHGQGPDHESIEWRLQGTVKELRRYVRDECYWLESGEIHTMRKAELLDNTMESLERDAHITLLNFEDMQNSYFKEYDLQIIPTYNGKPITLLSYETRGYCQRDYARVWYSPELLNLAWNNKSDESQFHKEIDHLFWDSPIYAYAEIDGVEYNYYDMPGAETYEWNREAWIAYLCAESGVNKADIDPLIPEYPEYN